MDPSHTCDTHSQTAHVGEDWWNLIATILLIMQQKKELNSIKFLHIYTSWQRSPVLLSQY